MTTTLDAQGPVDGGVRRPSAEVAEMHEIDGPEVLRYKGARLLDEDLPIGTKLYAVPVGYLEAGQMLFEAVRALSKIKDGKTLFEHSPTRDQECAIAWGRLNDAVAAANKVMSPK